MSPWIPLAVLLAITAFYLGLSLFIVARVFGSVVLKRGE